MCHLVLSHQLQQVIMKVVEDLDQLEMDLSPAPVPQCTPCYECVELKSQLRRMLRMRFRKNEVIKDLRKKLTDLKCNTQELGPVSLTLL